MAMYGERSCYEKSDHPRTQGGQYAGTWSKHNVRVVAVAGPRSVCGLTITAIPNI